MNVVLTQAGRLLKTGLGGRAWAKGGWVDAPAWAGGGSVSSEAVSSNTQSKEKSF